MSEGLFFPYRYARESLELSVTGISVDGDTLEVNEYADTEHNSLNLTKIESNWNELSLGVVVSDPNKQLETVTPPELGADSIDLWLTIRNRYARTRKSIQLVEREKGVWQGNLTLDSGELFRSTEMQCFAVLNTNESNVSGYASDRFERVGDSFPWHIYTDTIPPLPGGALNSDWRDFSEDSNQELRSRSDCVWYLDLTDPESPKLLLNEHVPGLRSVLEVAQKTGKAARVRDSLIHSILQGVLNELAVFVLAANDEFEHLEDLPDWQRKMLLTLARTNDSSTEEVTAENWLKAWSRKDGEQQAGLVLRDVTTAIQRHLNLYHSCEHLVKSIEKDLSDD